MRGRRQSARFGTVTNSVRLRGTRRKNKNVREAIKMAEVLTDSFAVQGGQRNFLPAAQEVKTWETSSLPATSTNPYVSGEFHE